MFTPANRKRPYIQHLPTSHMSAHPIPYIALSTSRRTLYQSALRSANSYTSSAPKMPRYRSVSAMMVASSLACAVRCEAEVDVVQSMR